MSDQVFHLKRAHNSHLLSNQRDGVGIRGVLMGVFAVFAACIVSFSQPAPAAGSCGSHQDSRVTERADSVGKVIQLAIKVEYVGGELTWTTSIPNKTCLSPTCKSGKGFRAEPAVPISARLMPFLPLANKSSVGGFDAEGKRFEPLELLGSRFPGFLFSVEHPPKLV